MWVDLNPIRGHEQAGRRPALVISTNKLNYGPSGLVMIIPMTTVDRNLPTWVPVDPPEGGVTRRSFIMCDQLRTVDRTRLDSDAVGSVEPATLKRVRHILSILLQL